MANRSDFYSAKLPRYYKRMISMGEAAGHYNKKESSDIRKLFIEAHSTHVGYKMKRNSSEHRDSTESE